MTSTSADTGGEQTRRAGLAWHCPRTPGSVSFLSRVFPSSFRNTAKNLCCTWAFLYLPKHSLTQTDRACLQRVVIHLHYTYALLLHWCITGCGVEAATIMFHRILQCSVWSECSER